VDGFVIGGLYLPNGNPYPGPKFDHKLRWFHRLHDYAAELLELEVPDILEGDENVMPTGLDVYNRSGGPMTPICSAFLSIT
jgi:exodeoxyribonuclease-3